MISDSDTNSTPPRTYMPVATTWQISASDLRGDSCDEHLFALRQRYAEYQERKLREALLAHLGYLPTFSDISKHGHVVNDRHGNSYITWMGEEIARFANPGW